MNKMNSTQAANPSAISGTFLSEISIDIPHNNWGIEEWTRDFEIMRSVGIDTVIFNLPAYKEQVCFNSQTLKNHFQKVRYTQIDFMDLFLDLAEKNQMSLFVGTYNGDFWKSGDTEKEFAISKDFCTEMVDLYGDRKAFTGWYLPYEMNSYWEILMELQDKLSAHIRKLKPLPVLTSPFMEKIDGSDYATTLAQYEFLWDRIWNRLQDCVDIVAFQDGHVPFLELADHIEINIRLANKYGLTSWSNLEAFTRNCDMGFYPLKWEDMKYKMDVAAQSGVEKIITWEFAHYLSPYSLFPSAGNLFNRYSEYLKAGLK